jgi:hypothetical protein
MSRLIKVLLQSFRSVEWGWAIKLRIWLLGIAFSIMLFGGSYIRAQVSTATIRGTVTDSTGGVLTGASVVATQSDTHISHNAVTGEDGSFVIPLLPVGSYSLKVSHDGFASYEQTGIVLSVAEDVSIPAVLRVGATAETVTVSADASMLDTTSTETASLVNQRQVEGLPLNGRNPANLVFLAGGVSNPIQNVPVTNTSNPVLTNSLVFPSEIAPTVHGVRAGGVYFSLDGANNVDSFEVAGGPFPNPDATREFSIVSGVFGAKYFSAPGGAVNIVTKSGTNQLHGSAFEFIRNGAVNAINYFATKQDVLKRNQFGGTLGGPIIRDRWFIFGSYQRTALSNEQGGLVAFTPTAAQRATVTDTVIKNLLQYIPLPGPNGSVTFSRPTIQRDNQYTVKTDVVLGSHQVFGRYFGEDFNQAPTGIPGGSMLGTFRGQIHNWYNATGGDTWTHGNLLNDLRVGFIRDHTQTVAGQNTVTWKDLGANIAVGQFPTLQGANVTGQFNVGAGNYNDFPRNTYSVNEDLSLLHGRHQLAFGMNYSHFSTTLRTDNTQNPTATFTGAFTGTAMGDFLTGQPSLFIQADGLFVQAHGVLPGFYAEDKYRMNNQLTLTGGLRWDPYIAYAPTNGRMMCYQPGVQSKVYTNAPLGETFPGDPNCIGSGAHSQYGIVEPRVGFAFQPASFKKAVIRGGYGLYSTQFALASFLAFGSTQPFERTFNITAPGLIDNPYATFPGGDPFASGFRLNGDVRPANSPFINPASAFAMSPDFKLQSVQSFSLAIDTAITDNDSLSVGYYGTVGRHQSAVVDLNQATYIPGGSTSGNTQARRPNTNIGTLRQEISPGNSSYNGLQTSFRHRARGGVSFQSDFNWSKALDDSSSPANVLLTAGSQLPSTTLLHSRHALADFDQNYTWRNSVVWNLPWLNHASGAKRFLGGWQINAILIDDAGLPFSVTDPTGTSFSGNGVEFADLVPGQVVSVPHPNIHAYFNKAAFTNAAPGTFGDSGRNMLRAPNYFNIDSAVVKSFSLAERTSLIARIEFFNTLNHPQFLPPNSALGSTLGTITSARDPRILQGSVKVTF